MESHEAKLVALLKEKGYTVSTSESCTGGLVAATIVNISGASDVFNEGYVTYSNEAKHKNLGVRTETLTAHGAVSEETCTEMCLGVARQAGADLGISTTGIAGPMGGTPEKPVGLVYIGCALHGKTVILRNVFKGTREEVRHQAVVKAIDLAVSCLENENK